MFIWCHISYQLPLPLAFDITPCIYPRRALLNTKLIMECGKWNLHRQQPNNQKKEETAKNKPGCDKRSKIIQNEFHVCSHLSIYRKKINSPIDGSKDIYSLVL